MHCPVPIRQCVSSAVRALSPSLSLRMALLGLVLQLLAVQGQSQQESLCTIAQPPTLMGLGSTPEDDRFGYDTSLSQDGTIAAIGAPRYGSNSYDGYVQVFRFENNAWTQLGSTIFGDTSTEASTNALSNDGSVLAVGGWYTRNVRVFRLVDDDWEPLGNNITNPNGEPIGYALAISGDGTILAASSPYANNDAGEVLLFEIVGGTWIQKGSTLQGQGEENYFGWSVSVSQDGSILAVGIPDYSNDDTSGVVRVFEFIDNDWVQIGQTLQGTNFGDQFGSDVSLSSDGQTLAVGAPMYDGNFNDSGSVHVYRYGSDGQWFEPGAVLIGKQSCEYIGRFLALSGDASILVASGFGLLRFFEADGNEWIEVGEEATDSQYNNYAAISRDGSTAMGGASVFDLSCPQGATSNTTTASPVLSPPPPTTPAPVGLPTSVPVEVPEETSTAVPALSQSPTGNTVPPVDNPIVSSPPTTPAGTQTSPTSAPQTNPTSGTMLQETFSDITLSFNGVSKMSALEIEMFERLTKEWYETFFVEHSGRMLQSLLLDARDMQTMIKVTNQNVAVSEDGSSLVNKITYNQTIAYTAESNNVNAKDYIILPFVDVAANTKYGETLKSELDAFQSLQSPLPIPQFETDTDTDTNASGDKNDSKGSAIGVLVGASIGGAVLLVIAVLVGIRVNKRRDGAGEGQSLPSAAGVIVYDGQGQALAPQTLAAPAVLLASDNPTILQKDTTEVQTPSPGLLEPSPPQQEIDTPMPEPMAVSTPSEGYVVQFKDQARLAAPERLALLDP